MFNRPEMISSQRMLRQTAIERLEQMRATTPNAKEAEDLLRCLVVFQSNIRRKDIIRMAPAGMDESTRINALMTLRYWSLVQRVSRHQYRIPDSIKRLYPPTHALLERYYARFFAIDWHSWDINLISDYWPDISAALLWAIEHQPTKLLYMAQGIGRYFYSPYVAQEWPSYLRLFLETAQRLNDIPLKALVFEQRGDKAYREKDFKSADDWYAQALTLYIQLGYQIKQASLCFMCGKIAHRNHTMPVIARVYYARAAALYPPTHRDYRSVLSHLFQLEVDEENLDSARAALERLLLVMPAGQQSELLFLFAQLLHKKSYYEEARNTFALALHQARDPSASKIYFAWGKMEYQSGSIQAGRNLCYLALAHRYPAEYPENSYGGLHEWEEFLEIRAWLTDMGCDDV